MCEITQTLTRARAHTHTHTHTHIYIYIYIYIYKLLVHIDLYKQMPSDICNKEIIISKCPFIRYLSIEPFGSHLKM